MDMKDISEVMKNPTGELGYKANANAVIVRPIPKDLIKEREGAGKMMLSYIEGETVITLLNEAFGPEGWSFIIVSKIIIPSEPKQISQYNVTTKKYEKVFNEDRTPKMESQPPIVEVHGRLIVPGFGVREQFGTKVLIGGSSEQEGASKAAATDALKKCATLFGIGLELYTNKGDAHKTSEKSTYQSKNYQSNARTPSSIPTNTPSVSSEENSWTGKDGEIRKLKELKAILGVDMNEKLDPYVVEFTGSKNDTYEKITPANISSFNKFLEKKASNA